MTELSLRPDEIAAALNKDPKDFLLEQIGPPRIVDPRKQVTTPWWNYGEPDKGFEIDTGRLRKVFSSVGIVFKGSGFYRTDSRNGESSAKDGAEKAGEKTGDKAGANASGGKDGGKDGGTSKESSSPKNGSSSTSSDSSSKTSTSTPAAAKA